AYVPDEQLSPACWSSRARVPLGHLTAPSLTPPSLPAYPLSRLGPRYTHGTDAISWILPVTTWTTAHSRKATLLWSPGCSRSIGTRCRRWRTTSHVMRP